MRHEIPRHWRLKKQRYGLVGDIDTQTGTIGFPPGTKHRFDFETKERFIEPEKLEQIAPAIFQIKVKEIQPASD